MRVFTVLIASFAFVLAAGTIASAGAPLKGVDIKLGKNPGGTAAARTTGADGSVNFGVLPKGAYYVVLAASKSSGAPSPAAAAVTIEGAQGASATWVWDFAAHVARSAAAAGARAVAADRIAFLSDGVHPVIVSAAVVKSKSNITNN